uniref:DHA2 family efflux MFS transporter permease subunit n=1 Tax=uncultured Bilophila sp. TaxID=529385 RepID=UPI0025ECD35C|nr:DHA2 family efflux MFS transporter permease subunit [uncultured Bilophila sp.]
MSGARTSGGGLEPLQGGRLALATIGISVVTAMTVLDSTIANVALPTIAGNLGVASSQGTWVITFFGVANAIAIPLTGWLARRFGEVRLYFWSTFLFVAASFLCGVSSSLGMLIAFRIVQGAAAGPLIPLSQSLLLACYPHEKRGIALSLWSMTIVLAPILGPILGGYICDNSTWHWIFFVNVPVGFVSLFLLRVPLEGRETPTARNPIDAVGLGLLIVGVGCLQLMLDEGKDKDWFASGYIVILGVCAVIGLVLLVVWELTEEHPVVDLSLFRHRNFAVGTVCISLGFLLYFAAVVLLPMMLQTRLGYTALWAGLSLAPVGVFPVLLAPIIGRFASRLDMRIMVTLSFIVFAICFFWRTRFAPNMDFAFIVWPQFVQGIGVALFFMPLTSIIISGLGPRDIANASSLSNCTRVLAGSIGSSIATTVWERQEALHHVRLTEAVNPFNPVAARGLHDLSSLGLSPEQVKAWIANEITRQGFLIGFNELFWLGGVLFLCLAGLVWLSTPIHRKGHA